MNDSSPPFDADGPRDPRQPVTLCPEDAAVVDALIHQRAAGLASGPMPPGSADREARVRALLAVLDRTPEGDSDRPATAEGDEALIARTLDAVNHHRQRERFAQQVQMVSARRGLGFNWRQVASVAALFLIAASLVLPVLERNRAEGNRIACAANLAMAGQAFGNYASDFADQLPHTRIDPEDVWWNPAPDPQPHADRASTASSTPPRAWAPNARNLYVLVRAGYIDADRLICHSNTAAATPTSPPGAGEDAPSARSATMGYSYQNQYRAQPLHLGDHPDLALLADKNPVFVVGVGRITRDTKAATDAPSRMHGRRGQNILLADGHVIWTFRPTLTRPGRGEDNIWTLSPDAPSASHPPNASDQPDNFLIP